MIIIGLMSGTSLDGLDIAACRFWEENSVWKFEILKAETIEYNATEIAELKNAFYANGNELISLHHSFGKNIGQKVQHFLQQYNITPEYISSHGHTVFHQPQNGFTFQLGHGADIAAQSGIKTICDFRTTDVAYGGQGAPLVPIGDELLFSAFDYCLNLGGISNISFNENGIRKAFDIGICNIALNHLVQEINLKYDKDGLIAQSGKTNESLLNQLINAAKINHLNQHSLGFEWYKNFMEPLLRLSEASIPDKLSTVCEFIALQIAHTINTNGKILITGGGAKNKFLIECIKHKVNNQIVIPDEQLTDFKEALIFAFLGMLRVNESVNALCQVTGASKDTSGGCIYLP